MNITTGIQSYYCHMNHWKKKYISAPTEAATRGLCDVRELAGNRCCPIIFNTEPSHIKKKKSMWSDKLLFLTTKYKILIFPGDWVSMGKTEPCNCFEENKMAE